MKRHFIYLFAVLAIAFAGCQKELSQEQGNVPAEGSLQSDVSGDCLPKTVNGAYIAGTALTTGNTIQVAVNVIKTGRYEILTDTINGYYFSAKGIFTSVGSNLVTLKSNNGTPFTDHTDNFTVSFDSTFCNIAVDVLPPGSGPANFTLVSGGTPSNCASAAVSGTYAVGISAVNASNYVDITVNVATIGTYDISATGGGMTFSKIGAFTATGNNQTVRLLASGTPTTGGINTITFTKPSTFTSCNFTVNVTAPASGSLGGTPGACTPATINGVYMVGKTLGAGDTVQIQVTITSPGAVNISTGLPVTGFSFSYSGVLALGTHTIPLTASGTPTTAGPQNFTVSFGTSTCTFTINVSAADYFPRTANSNWSYEYNDVSTDSIYRTVLTPTLSANANTYNIFMEEDGTLPGLDSSGYYRKNGGDYFEWVNLEDYGADLPVWMEYIMLKDNVAALTTWKTPTAGVTIVVGGTPTKIRFSNQILQKDVSITLTTSGSATPVTYTNVIVVEQKIESEVLPNVWQDVSAIFGSGKSYYALGIGLIKFELISPFGGFVQELRRYKVF
jgi:hypothetical protein